MKQKCPICDGELERLEDRDPGSGTNKILIFCKGECGICAPPSGWQMLAEKLRSNP
jgi:hypothetical protein